MKSVPRNLILLPESISVQVTDDISPLVFISTPVASVLKNSFRFGSASASSFRRLGQYLPTSKYRCFP
jgi:hypothetical protein